MVFKPTSTVSSLTWGSNFNRSDVLSIAQLKNICTSFKITNTLMSHTGNFTKSERCFVPKSKDETAEAYQLLIDTLQNLSKNYFDLYYLSLFLKSPSVNQFMSVYDYVFNTATLTAWGNEAVINSLIKNSEPTKLAVDMIGLIVLLRLVKDRLIRFDGHTQTFLTKFGGQLYTILSKPLARSKLKLEQYQKVLKKQNELITIFNDTIAGSEFGFDLLKPVNIVKGTSLGKKSKIIVNDEVLTKAIELLKANTTMMLDEIPEEKVLPKEDLMESETDPKSSLMSRFTSMTNDDSKILTKDRIDVIAEKSNVDPELVKEAISQLNKEDPKYLRTILDALKEPDTDYRKLIMLRALYTWLNKSEPYLYVTMSENIFEEVFYYLVKESDSYFKFIMLYQLGDLFKDVLVVENFFGLVSPLTEIVDESKSLISRMADSPHLFLRIEQMTKMLKESSLILDIRDLLNNNYARETDDNLKIAISILCLGNDLLMFCLYKMATLEELPTETVKKTDWVKRLKLIKTRSRSFMDVFTSALLNYSESKDTITHQKDLQRLLDVKKSKVPPLEDDIEEDNDKKRKSIFTKGADVKRYKKE